MNGTAQLGPKEKGLEARLAGDDTLGQPPPPGVGVTSEAAAAAYTQAQQAQALLVQAMERERQAIERERAAIQRERESMDSERKRMALAASSVPTTPPDQWGRLEDAEKSEGEAIAKERRMLAEEREAVERLKKAHKREKEALDRQQREQEQHRQQMDEDRVKIEREVQMMANLAAVETQVLKEALERMKLERGAMEKEREQLWSQVQQLTAAQEQLAVERDDLMAENERLEKSRDALLGIQRDRGAEGLQAERDRVEAERREREQTELQLARDTVERDKQEIEKIRVEIENIMKAWEIERDRQAKERLQIDAEKEELAAVRAEAERQWRQMTAGMPGMPAGIPRLASILAQQSAAAASAAGVSPIAAMPVLPSFAAMTMNANGGLSLAPATSAAGFLVDDKQPQPFTPVHQPRGGSSSLTTSPVSTPPQPSSVPATSSSTGAKRKRKRGDSLNLSAGNSTSTHQESASEADFKKRRKVRPWEERFEELLQFKEKHGHFSVPAGGDYASLRIWVNNQKALHTKGQLAADRFEKLNVIGFPWWNPKGNRSGKGKKNEDGDESTTMVDVKKEESAQPSVGGGGGQAHEEDKAQRRKELEAFFGCSLEPYPALVHKFAAKNAERAIDNAIVWLTMPPQKDQQQGGEKSESDANKKSESEAESLKPKSEETKAMAERREKVALLRRIEGIVGLGDDPLRELMEKGGFRVFSSDVSLRREDLDWLIHHYDEIKSAFLLSTFSKKVNKGDWNQKLLMNEVEKIYASFLGFDLQHRNLRTKFLSTLGKAVSEWSYYLPRDHFTLWSHAVCLRAKHLSLQQLSGGEGGASLGLGEAQLLQFDRDRFLVDRRPSLGDVDSGRSDGPNPLVRLLNLPYLVDMDHGSPTTSTSTFTTSTEPTASARRPSVDADPAQSTSSRASSPPSLSSSSSSSLNNSTDEGVSSLLNSFNLPNFPSYVHKKPFQRRRGSSSVPGASLAALAYQHMQQTQQPQPPHVSEVIIEEVSSDGDDEHEMVESSTTTTTRTTSPGRAHPHQQATVEEIEEEDDDDDDDVAPPHIVRPIAQEEMDLEGIDGESGGEEEESGGPSAGREGELMIDLNDDGDGEEDHHTTCPPPPRE
ncbi:helicase associated domain containing protein [Acanthamoeba castellanii str. Neff]|uniref:Helicase associated domain containing protein n=1 Tax=Acanthamoeba castellanii (strain ATCC 30010 / Neff) TaxID=1257118 RepID=L8H354_ACACF|nr:helicase associated domain containing protein [Acanthamoeba castellanii str. Neff]ELR19615.1 helicase associated domain containing protein [Acanthamoeba castellanii str. Neff]